MRSFIARKIPDGLWKLTKARAAAEGLTTNQAFLKLISGFANGQIKIIKGDEDEQSKGSI